MTQNSDSTPPIPDDLDRIRQALRWVPSGYTNCNGDKCRQMNCSACWMYPDEAPGPAVGLKALDRLALRLRLLQAARDLEEMAAPEAPDAD